MIDSTLQKAFELVSELVRDFEANLDRYKSPDYQEAEVRKDYIDKFLIALDRQIDPCVWELKVLSGLPSRQELGSPSGGNSRRHSKREAMAG